MITPYKLLEQFCQEAERLDPCKSPFSPGVLEYVTATLKLFLADKEKSLNNVFTVKRNKRGPYKTTRPGKEARIAIRASRLRTQGVTWEQIAEQVGYPYPDKLPGLIKQYAERIETENKRVRSK